MAENRDESSVKDIVEEALKTEPVEQNDVRATEILKQLKENAALATKVWGAYTAARTKEAIEQGKKDLSTSMDEMAQSVVGKLDEKSKAYAEYEEGRRAIIAEWDGNAKKFAAFYDRGIDMQTGKKTSVGIMDLIAEMKAVKMDSIARRAHQHMLKKAMKAQKKETKGTSKNLEAYMQGIAEVRSKAFQAMKEGNLTEYQHAMEEANRMEASMQRVGFASTSKYANLKAAFEQNRAQLKANKERIEDLKTVIQNRQDQKENDIRETMKEKRKELAIHREEKGNGLRNVVTMFLSRFAINKGRQLKTKVLEPASKWIKENFEQAKQTITERATQFAEDVKTTARTVSLDAIDRLGRYVEEKQPMLEQMQQGKADRGIMQVNGRQNGNMSQSDRREQVKQDEEAGLSDYGKDKNGVQDFKRNPMSRKDPAGVGDQSYDER